ncbi:MAG: alpha-glucan family phosphorylase [Candidatus Woesearchaeota archaeon]
MQKHERTIAYMTMEIAITSDIPTYSGGLGVLAGDTIMSHSDLGVPSVCVTLLNKEGYFYQKISPEGHQIEEPFRWTLTDYLQPLDTKITIELEDRTVTIRPWVYHVKGERGHEIPVYFLDTDLKENTPYDRSLTEYLYGGDRYYRFCQEMILGIGGVRMLEALGYKHIDKYHLNEGHAALACVELLHKNQMNIEAVKNKCIFTTHTPVAAGHDTFDIDMVGRVIKDYYPWNMKFAEHDGKFNMTYLALNLSDYVNGVAKKHKEVSMQMFPGREIHSITNGIYHRRFITKYMDEVFTKHIPDWAHDPFSLRSALAIPDEQIWYAHQENKKKLINYINKNHKTTFDTETFTIGFARRMTAYKRPELLFRDIEWLKAIAHRQGKIQIVFAGKAHVNDGFGKDAIFKLNQLKDKLGPDISLVYLENYDTKLSQLMTAGVDIWLNTPHRPYEASGTSGMKAALNGTPHFSVLDGWWIEGHIEGVTGWSIGPATYDNCDDDEQDSRDLYEKLEQQILPKYYLDRHSWIRVMKHTIAMNASFFHTHRMVSQYVTNAYFK